MPFRLLIASMIAGVATAATCGSGSVGDGVCVNTLKCCTPDGYCSFDSQACANIAAPVAPGPSPPPVASSQGLQFPNYATGDCSNYDEVMTVNLGYYQSWAIFRPDGCNPVAPEDLDVDGNGYTHLAYTFASIDSNFELEPWMGNYDDEVPRYEAFNALKLKHPTLKTIVAIGGWTFNNPGDTEYRFSDAASTAANRAALAASCVAFCQKYNFNGIDLDWEFPGDTAHGGRSEDKANFALMVQAIREAFDAAGDFIITVATPVSQRRLDDGFDLMGLAQAVDFFHIMTYNIHTHYQQDKIIGANTDMTFIFNSIQYFLDAGVSPTKLVLGLAAYGRSYILEDSSCATEGCFFVDGGAAGGCVGSRGFMPYFTINEFVQNGTYQSMYLNPDTLTMELYVDQDLYVSYDNPDTYEIKRDYSAKSCFRGVFWWSADMKGTPIFIETNAAPSAMPVPTTPFPTSAPSLAPVGETDAPSSSSATFAPSSQPTKAPVAEFDPTAAPVSSEPSVEPDIPPTSPPVLIEAPGLRPTSTSEAPIKIKSGWPFWILGVAFIISFCF